MSNIFTKETIEGIKAVAKCTLALGLFGGVCYGVGWINGAYAGGSAVLIAHKGDNNDETVEEKDFKVVENEEK